VTNFIEALKFGAAFSFVLAAIEVIGGQQVYQGWGYIALVFFGGTVLLGLILFVGVSIVEWRQGRRWRK
jgi:membrane protein implicated in regulation of membrane protease activity